MDKRLLYFTFLLLAFTPLLSAQNNPYKIDDGLYAYYQQCNKQIKETRVLLMADTLFSRAGRKGDQKAQCLALHLKCDYHYYRKDIPALKEANKKLQEFARKTPFQQYIFSCWNRLISIYIRDKRYDIALEECRAYQQEAIKLNNSYGIGMAYRNLGNIYYQKQDLHTALELYKQGIQYHMDNNNIQELMSFYRAILPCYQQLSLFDSVVYYGKKTLKLEQRQSERVPLYLSLCNAYISKSDLDNAKVCIDSVESLRCKIVLAGVRFENYQVIYARYCGAIGQYDQALALLDCLSDSLVMASQKTHIYIQMGDYKKACDWSMAARKFEQASMRKENASMLADYTSRFDNERLEAEKTRLFLQNVGLNLRRLEDERLLMLADKERDSLGLMATGLKLQNSELALTNQRVETERQKERAVASEKENRQKVIIIGMLGLLFVVSIVYFFITLRHRRKSLLRVQKEKEIAIAARSEAEQARLEAVNANNLKSLFLQNMSHEIRTPLNAIVGFTSVLNDEDMKEVLDPDERKEMVGLIETNSTLLTTLVNDILDLSKLESNTYTLIPSPVIVSELCHNTVKSIESRAAAGVELRVEEPEYAESIVFNTDSARLQQVLTNFLTNACKYTDKGSITLAYKVLEAEEGMEFSVTDTGCGIPPEKAEKVFTRFEKLDSFKQGTGIGLNICRRIAGLVDGKVYVDTTYTGGARFVFVHPPLKTEKTYS